MAGDSKSYNTFETAQKERHPLDVASVWSKLDFGRVEPLIAVGNQRQLAPDDIWPLQDEHKVTPLCERFAVAYRRRGQSILKTFFSVYVVQFLMIGLLQLFVAVCGLYGPGFVLGQVIAALESPTFDSTYVVQLVGSLVVLSVAIAFAKAHGSYLNATLSAKSKKEKTAGDIANLFGVDMMNVMDVAQNVHQIWIVPLQVVVVLVLLFQVVGWASIVGLGLVAAIMAINARAAVVIGSTEDFLFERKDHRMTLLHELFSAIQIVKFNAWEEKFQERVEASRAVEVEALRAFYACDLILTTLANCTPVLVTLAVFATYTLVMHQVLTVSVVFSTVALFKSLQDVMANLPNAIMSLTQCLISAKRINHVLLMDEFDPTNVQTPTDMSMAVTYGKDKVVVAIEDGSFGWDADNL
ncbi:unnamed protein product, partial [Aphanomyces euteiches]